MYPLTASVGNPGMEWEYLEMSQQFRSEYVPQEDGTYELTVVVGPPPHSVVLVEIEIWTRRMTSGVLLSSTQR